MATQKKESWASRIGVIAAVAASAVGVGNFLRFPGQVAEYGGGAFMLVYFAAFVLLGIPMCWVEWTIGRYAGSRGCNSLPGIFTVVIRKRWARYLGALCLVVPTVIFMYLIGIQAWCLGYAVNAIAGKLHFASADQASDFFQTFTGLAASGAAMGWSIDRAGLFLAIVFVFNFVLIYRGIAKGIELFCKIALPTLLIIAIVLVIRVMTLGAPVTGNPQASISTGLGFMWNPQKVVVEMQVPTLNDGAPRWLEVKEVVGSKMIAHAQAEIDELADSSLRLRTITLWEQLLKPQLWLAAASQIFFSLSVGFGLIATYASYLNKKDDLVLSSLAAAGANEFSEVALGGLLTIPAAVTFLGIGALSGQTSLFSLGFQVLPMVFAQMPGGDFFGFLFFMLLFLASVSGCLSTLQPGIAFLEEALPTVRKQSIAILGLVVAIGAFMVFYFSEGLKALDTLDFWVGSFLIFAMAIAYSIMFGWVMPLDNAWEQAHEGSALKIPRIFRPIIKYLCPILLLAIFICWMGYNLFAVGSIGIDLHVADLIGDTSTGIESNYIARIAVCFVCMIFAFYALLASGVNRYNELCDQSRGGVQ